MFSIFLKSCELLSARSKGTQSGVMFGMVVEGVGGWRGSPVVAVIGEWLSLVTVAGRANPVLPCWHESEL